MHLFEGLILGLSTGVACIAFCGPILIPYLLTEAHTMKQSFIDVSWFLGGRFIAYVITGFLAGLLGSIIFENELFRKISGGWLYIILAIAMIVYAFYRVKHVCLGESKSGLTAKLKSTWPHLLPVFGGFTSGINLCPPFVLAITQASLTKNITESIFFFIAFFMGTAVYFIPMPFISLFRRKQNFQLIGKFAATIVGAMYLYKGILIILK
jgi:sulfite exporter TauE/SafE